MSCDATVPSRLEACDFDGWGAAAQGQGQGPGQAGAAAGGSWGLAAECGHERDVGVGCSGEH